MRAKLIFAWYDFWIGFFWDSKKKLLYFFPIPMFGIVFDFYKLRQKAIKKANQIEYNNLMKELTRDYSKEAKDYVSSLDLSKKEDREKYEKFITESTTNI